VILEKQRVGWLSARSRRPMSQVRAILPEALSVSRSTSAGVTTDSASSYRAIENLIATYAELVDGGDFAGIGALLADASFTGGSGTVSGREACGVRKPGRAHAAALYS
jgi:hypothetical protein